MQARGAAHYQSWPRCPMATAFACTALRIAARTLSPRVGATASTARRGLHQSMAAAFATSATPGAEKGAHWLDPELSKAYSQFRPTYPDSLYALVLSELKDPSKGLTAVDVGCGTGQATRALLADERLATVLGVDPSEAQVAEARAATDESDGRIRFQCAKAEEISVEDGSVSLVTVAQAVHWFEHEAFNAKVNRMLRPGGVYACWSYGVNTLDNTAAANAAYQRFYHETIGLQYWPPERVLIDHEYTTIPMPFPVERRDLEMSAEMPLSRFMAYLGTWSGVQNFRRMEGRDPLAPLHTELLAAAQSDGLQGDDPSVTVTWPVFVYLGVKPEA